VTSTLIDDASHALFPGQPDAAARAVLGYGTDRAGLTRFG
jgi:hypothetical protein